MKSVTDNLSVLQIKEICSLMGEKSGDKVTLEMSEVWKTMQKELYISIVLYLIKLFFREGQGYKFDTAMHLYWN